MKNFEFGAVHMIMTLVIVFLSGVIISNWSNLNTQSTNYTNTTTYPVISTAGHLCLAINSMPSKIESTEEYFSQEHKVFVADGKVICDNGFTKTFTVQVQEDTI